MAGRGWRSCSGRVPPLVLSISPSSLCEPLSLDLHRLRGPETVRVVQRSGHSPDLALHGEHRSSPSGRLLAVVGGVIEFGGAIAVALGLGARLAGLALFGDMVMAMITVTWVQGLHQATPPGYELNVALAALALVVALLGAGRFSVDALAERRLVATGEGSAS